MPPPAVVPGGSERCGQYLWLGAEDSQPLMGFHFPLKRSVACRASPASPWLGERAAAGLEPGLLSASDLCFNLGRKRPLDQSFSQGSLGLVPGVNLG